MTRYYSTEELEFLRSHTATPRRELTAMFNRRFRKRRSVASIVSAMTYHRWPRKPRVSVQVRMNHRGYLEVRQSDGRMRAAKAMAWEAVIGEVPPGHVLVPIYGDRLDLDPFNWLLVSRGLQVRLVRNGFFEAPHELKPTILAVARLCQSIEHATGKRLHDSSHWRRVASLRKDGR